MLGRLIAVVALVTVGFCGTATAREMKINSITFSAPAPLKAGDIITVDLAGNPGVRAAFSIKGLVSTIRLNEVSAGSYHGSIKVPSDKFVRNAPLVGYLGNDAAHATPVQASRLISVLNAAKDEPTRLPPVLPEPHTNLVEPPAPPAPEPIAVAPPAPKPTAPPAPVAADDKSQIVLTSPMDGAALRRAITVKGNADPNSTLRITITYNNNLSGMLRLAGNVASQDIAAGKNGEFRMGPIALDGALATDGLRFMIKAYYPDRADHGTAQICVIGKRD